VRDVPGVDRAHPDQIMQPPAVAAGQRRKRHRRIRRPVRGRAELSDLGVAESQSSRWQQLVVAALSDNTGRKLTD